MCRQPPPVDSKPEAMNFPSTHYSMSEDAAPYIAPQRYPSPPKNMWYEVPKEPPAPPAQPPKPLFPWEGHQPRPSRSFAVESFVQSQTELAEAQQGEHESVHPPRVDTENPPIDSPAAETGAEPQTPTTPTVKVNPPPPSDWNSFQHSNAWDEIPEIGRYVEGLQKHKRGRSVGSVGTVASPVPRGPGGRRSKPGFKLTDFPTAVERPSLPVTPAPVTRSSYWSHGEADAEDADSSQALPAAEGVPAQSDWVCVHGKRWTPSDCLCDLTDLVFVQKDPEEQLRKLAKLQHETLLRKLGSQEGDVDETGGGPRVIPKRSLPFGSEDFKSPTYVEQVPPVPISAPKPPASLVSEVSGTTLVGGPPPPTRRAAGRGILKNSLLESPLPDPSARSQT